ncbi:MAG: phosphate ABC transporter substrate-binding protein, partial [Defluviitaleaceae bacterium]|nr:phosphate ABC transporter substrate-binding protein [Defluviitaleaceae bacterium]
MVKKIIKSLLGLSMVTVMGLSLTGCGGDSEQITVVTREDASGTRGAFVEIVDITVNGNDNIYTEAVVAPG